MGHFLLTAFSREVTYFTCFLMNSLCPKTMKMIVDLRQFAFYIKVCKLKIDNYFLCSPIFKIKKLKFIKSTEQRLCFKSTIISIVFGHEKFIKKHVNYVTSLQNTGTEKESHASLIPIGFLQ